MIGLVNLFNLDNPASLASVPAKRSRKAASAHCLTNAVAYEPCRLESDSKGAVQLVRADALLAASDQIERLEPKVHWDVGLLEDGPDSHAELLAADVALVEAEASCLALHLGNALGALAVGANRAMRPQMRLNPGVGGLFVLQVVERQKRHGESPMRFNIVDLSGFEKYNMPTWFLTPNKWFAIIIIQTGRPLKIKDMKKGVAPWLGSQSSGKGSKS